MLTVTREYITVILLPQPAHSSGRHILYTIEILKAVHNTFSAQAPTDTRPLNYTQQKHFPFHFYSLNNHAQWPCAGPYPWVNGTTLKSHKQCQLCPPFSPHIPHLGRQVTQDRVSGKQWRIRWTVPEARLLVRHLKGSPFRVTMLW